MIKKLRIMMLENRRLAPGMAVIGVLVLLLIVKWGYSRHMNARAEIAAYREALATSSEMLARGGDVKERIAREQKRLKALERGLLKASEPSMAAAELQEAFKRLIVRKNISISSENVLGFEEAGKYMKIPVEFHLKAALRELTRLLYEIEASPAIMRVRSMHVVVPYSGDKAMINVTLVLEGVIKKGGART